MGRVIVITSGKGGVGKTTATANIGTGLAQNGQRVCLIDADIGLRNLDLVMGLENRIVFDVVDVLEKKCRSYRQALIKDKRFEHMYLLPAAQSREKDAVKPDQMRELCNELRTQFDFVIIDCPAGIENGFKNAIAGADEAIIVTNPEVSAVRDADRIVGLLEAEEKYNPRLIVNRLKSDMVKRGQMLSVDDVKGILNIPILGIIPEDEKVLHASNKGEPAVLDQQSRAGAAYRQVVLSIQHPEQAPADFRVPSGAGWWQRFVRMLGLNDQAAVR